MLLSHLKKFGLLALILLSLGASKLYARQIEILTVKGVIDPVVARYVINGFNRAEKVETECVIIKLDTPGGLMESMESITQKMLNSPIPSVVYVWPQGARAASAGVFIAYAADIAVMAPSTNIGAAHPVTMGQKADSTMMEKITNDAVARIKGMAKQKGRNAEWAEEAVRKSVSITSDEALKLGVIDFIASDLKELLDRLDGWRLKREDQEIVIKVKEAHLQEGEMNFVERLLHTIANPNIAYILLLFGVLGLIYEFHTPGIGFPGVVGMICLILAFFSLQILPINLAGLLLIVIAIIFFILDLQIVSHGILTIGGIISLTMGSLMLFSTPGAAHYYRISLVLVISVVAATTLFFLFAITAGLRAQRKVPVTGVEGMIGQMGMVRTRLDPQGTVLVMGEYWNAVSSDGEAIEKGEKVEVVELDRRTVKVKKVRNSS
jgi:membrane-bound serine protease (ClpP class)